MLLLVPFLRSVIVGLGLFLLAQTLACRALGLRGVLHLREARTGALAPLSRRLVARGCGVAATYLLSAGLATLGYASLDEPTARIRVVPGTPAQRAGLQDGDFIERLDGEPLHGFGALRAHVQAASGRPLRLTVDRRGERLEVVVQPDAEGRIGVFASGELIAVQRGEALRQGATAPLRAVPGLLLLPKRLLDNARAMQGPVMQYAGSPGPQAFQGGSENRWGWLLIALGFELALAWPLALLLCTALTVAEQRRLRAPAALAP
jgi:membrane-associated protease RseP (regulator of RpoE activity)